MQQSHLIVLAALVLFVGILYFAGFLTGSAEGFTTTQCPIGYSFFTNPAGISLCCKGGTINPYTNQCLRSSASSEYALCAFVPNIPDPSDPIRKLPLCSDVATVVAQQAGGGECPDIYPNYAVENSTGSIAKCCKSTLAVKVNGYNTCSSKDIENGNFCIAKGPADATKGERLCSEVNTDTMLKNVSCPTSEGYFKFDYTFGTNETAATAYGAAATGVKIPVCTTISKTCLPKESIAYAQKYGAFKALSSDAERKKWKFSCDYETPAAGTASIDTYLVPNPPTATAPATAPTTRPG